MNDHNDDLCTLCHGAKPRPYRVIEGIPYFECPSCLSILADESYLRRSEAGKARVYDDSYWQNELSAAAERCYGTSLIRVGEVFHYARRPIEAFLDVSCGSGALLDAISQTLPNISNRFWGVEPFPPPEQFRSTHPNYIVSFLDKVDQQFDAGVCIEVIEHLTPGILRQVVQQISRVSRPDALWYFNSAQPSFVKRHDPGYLDPFVRGHIASYSLSGLRPMFAEAGLVIHELPGRDWAFLAEKSSRKPMDSNEVYKRVWKILPENREALLRNAFGPLILSSGFESARSFLEFARSEWANGQLAAGRKGLGLGFLRRSR